MKLNNSPFTIELINPSASTYDGMLPVKSGSIFDSSTGDYHPHGLYSNMIFGKPGDKRRDLAEGFIDLKTKILAPFYFRELIATKRLYSDIIYGTGYAIWDETTKDFNRATMLDGQTGVHFFMSHMKELVLKRGRSGKRNMTIDFLEANKSKAFLDRFLVIPAGLRDIEINDDGRPVEDDLNQLYRRLISVSNLINPLISNSAPELLDLPRANLTKTALAIFMHIYNIIEGKRGFAQAKFARRRIFGSTRNVISAMPLGSIELGDERQLDVNTLMVGTFQFLKGNEYKVMYQLRHGYLKPFFDGTQDRVNLVDRKTLKAVNVELDDRSKDKWGTDDGLVKTFNSFSEGSFRHNPVIVDGHYLSLIYRGSAGVRLLGDIDELPSHLDKKDVYPITWGELWYIHCAKIYKDVRVWSTRYPVATLGSTIGCKVYLRSTVTSDVKVLLNDQWEPTDEKLLEYPHVNVKAAYYATMSVHNVYLNDQNADFDGDQENATFVSSKEAIAEMDAKHKDHGNYLSPNGEFKWNFTSKTTTWILSAMTGWD